MIYPIIFHIQITVSSFIVPTIGCGIASFVSKSNGVLLMVNFILRLYGEISPIFWVITKRSPSRILRVSTKVSLYDNIFEILEDVKPVIFKDDEFDLEDVFKKENDSFVEETLDIGKISKEIKDEILTPDFNSKKK